MSVLLCKTEECLCAMCVVFDSARLSHVLNLVWPCSSSECCDTETALKETARPEKPAPSEQLLTLSTVLGHTRRCRSHTAPLVQWLEVCGELFLSWADPAPVEGAHLAPSILEPLQSNAGCHSGCAVWQKNDRPPGESVEKSKWYRPCWLLRTAGLISTSVKQYFPCNSPGCAAEQSVVQTVSSLLGKRAKEEMLWGLYLSSKGENGG